MPDILHDLTIAAPAGRVFELLTTSHGLRRWWTDSSRAADEVGHVNVFGFDGDQVQMHFRVDASERPHRLAWTCVDHPAAPREWVGTAITAELAEDGGKTRLRFAHRAWASDSGAFALCNTTWGALMHRLRDAAEGRPTGPLFGVSARDVVKRYYEAWTVGRFDEAAELLDPELDFRGPIDRFDRRAPFVEALRRLGPITQRTDLHACLDAGNEVVLIYDLVTAVPAIGTIAIAEWFCVRDGRISRIRLFFDPRPYAALFPPA